MRELRKEFSLNELLAFYDVPKSSYLHWEKTADEDADAGLREKVKRIFVDTGRIYGFRRIILALRKEGLTVNHKKVRRLMREMDLVPRMQKAEKRYSSYKGTVGKVAKNVLKRKFDVKEPDTVWTSDVTEFKTGEGKVYLSPITDLCTGAIISYMYSASPNMDMVMTMLRTAITAHPCIDGLVFHTDQGWQYQHATFVNCLKANDIIQSMSRKGNCIDNCKMETFFGHMKREMYYGREFKTKQELFDAIDEYIRFYNEERIQAKLNGLSPVEFRKQAA
ncbi:MAG: IS3 family transposase [Spirochaetales bacterium]|nr:IS3 family transposase [Candidatus Physcosoma equi]